MEVQCFSKNFLHVNETKRWGCTEKTMVQCSEKDKVVILITFPYIKLRGLLKTVSLQSCKEQECEMVTFVL